MNLPEEIYTTYDEDITAFLAAINQVDKVLQLFSTQNYSGQYQERLTSWYSHNHSPDDTPLWGGQSMDWNNSTPEFDIDCGSRLGKLVNEYDLTDFEVAVLILGCLNTFEPHYRTLFEKLPLQERKMPTLALAQVLFLPGVFIRHAQQTSLRPDAPLIKYGLIELHPSNAPQEMQSYTTSEYVIRWLLGECYLPDKLQFIARWLTPSANESVPGDDVISCCRSQDDLQMIEVRYEEGAEGEIYVANLAQCLNSKALLVSWQQLISDRRSATDRLKQLMCIARLYQCLIVFSLDKDVMTSNDESDNDGWVQPRLEQQIYAFRTENDPLPVCCLLPASSQEMPFPKLTRLQVSISLPTASERHAYLTSLLSGREIDWDVEKLTQRVALSCEKMRNAVSEAEALSMLQGKNTPAEDDFRQAFANRARQNFGTLAMRFTPVRGWENIIVSEDIREQLNDVLSAVRGQNTIIAKGFGSPKGRAIGVSALFYGDSGTGKTLVAEVLAAELGVDLIRVDLSTVMNKYIGETEKNLARIFDLAAQDAGVLFFDEADALFGKRTETKDAKDRHANVQVAYLLQRLEQHPGLVILATNHRSHLDDAFTRRFTFMIQFSYPDAGLREMMWRQVWPEGCKLDPNLDFSLLAKVPLTGANIRNVAFLASCMAANTSFISLHHIEKSIKRELSKYGRGFS